MNGGKGDNKIYVQVPVNENHPPDALVLQDAQALYNSLYAAMLSMKEIMDPEAGLGWSKLMETGQVTGKRLFEDVAWKEGQGWHSIRLKWDRIANYEPGKLYNMTKENQVRTQGVNVHTTPDGYKVNLKERFFYVGNLKQGFGIDGTFAVPGFWADNLGNWGFMASIREMRVYKPESFESKLAKFNNLETDSKDTYDFDY